MQNWEYGYPMISITPNSSVHSPSDGTLDSYFSENKKKKLQRHFLFCKARSCFFDGQNHVSTFFMAKTIMFPRWSDHSSAEPLQMVQLRPWLNCPTVDLVVRWSKWLVILSSSSRNTTGSICSTGSIHQNKESSRFNKENIGLTVTFNQPTLRIYPTNQAVAGQPESLHRDWK